MPSSALLVSILLLLLASVLTFLPFLYFHAFLCLMLTKYSNIFYLLPFVLCFLSFAVSFATKLLVTQLANAQVWKFDFSPLLKSSTINKHSSVKSFPDLYLTNTNTPRVKKKAHSFLEIHTMYSKLRWLCTEKRTCDGMIVKVHVEYTTTYLPEHSTWRVQHDDRIYDFEGVRKRAL